MSPATDADPASGSHVLQGTLVLADRLAEHGQVVIGDGLIQKIVADGRRYSPAHDYGDAFVLPGLIDLHTHGIAGVDVMDASQESLDVMARRLASHGATGFLPTTVTDDVEITRHAVTSIREYMDAPRIGGARVLGIHLEGPFINSEYKGMQNLAHILLPNEEIMTDLLERSGGNVRRVSLAPEMPQADSLIRSLRNDGIYVSIAHTGATYDQALDAVRLGATQVTHCFNSMSGLHHRNPGTVGAAMLCENLYCELIADGIHVHPAVMRLLIRVKGRERVMLVTDAMLATDMPDGIYHFGGQEITVRDRVARLVDGTLAGSTLTMDAAVRDLVHLCQVSLVDAVYMASSTPAEAIGLGSSKGKLQAGYDADLTILDSALQPVATWVGGEGCFSADRQ